MKVLTSTSVAVIAVIAVIAIAAAGLAGSGFYLYRVESATVDISLPAWKLESWAEVHGATTGGQFRTQRAQVTLTATVTGTATGSVLVGAGQFATGYVVVNHHCTLPDMTCTVAAAPRGSVVCRTPSLPNPPTTISACYVLEAAATCLCGERVPVRAQYSGSSWNTAAYTINLAVWNEPYGAAADVSNPAPITGGGDGTPVTAVSQSDIDSASASARSQLSVDLQSALLVAGGGLEHLIPDGAPQITVASSVAAGARTKTFQVTATGTLGATEFRDSDAAAQIAQGIDQWVPKGYRLNGAPVVIDYKVLSADEQGRVVVDGKAVDYLVPAFSLEVLRSRLRGATVASARALIETVAPGSQVDIRLGPAAMPVLPIDSARITVLITLRPAG